MCLDIITKTVKLTKDKRVWKYVVMAWGLHPTSPHYSTNLNRRKCVATRNYIHAECGTYRCGFHCFVRSSTAKKYLDFWSLYSHTDHVVMEFIIPAGTTVTYGKEFKWVTIVSPVLINPNAPKEDAE